MKNELTFAKGYRADIDGLRAVAVVLVLAFHAFPRLLPGGFVGVDVFFTISGYLITGIILSRMASGTFTLGDFYSRRARRILPALAITLAATLSIGWLILSPSAYRSLGLHSLAGTLFVPNLIFWSEVGYFDPAAENKPLLHLWSLGVEEQFYLLWPVLLMILSKHPKQLVVTLSMIVAVSFLYSCNHWPLLSLAAINGLNSVGQRVAIVGASIVLSILTYQLLEKPIRFGRLRRSGIVASVVAVIGLAGLSALAFLAEGIPSRVPAEIRPALALADYNPHIDARYEVCWLDATKPFELYGTQCRSGSTLIWGDSHAARLYSGFVKSGMNVAQFTRDGCLPSLVNTHVSSCDKSNAAIIEEIKRLKPHRVIVFCAWLNHNIEWQLKDERVEAISRAVAQLRQTVDDVVVLGPAPIWMPDLPTAAFRYWTKNRSLPDRMQPAAHNYQQADEILAMIAHQQGARFISVFHTLCNAEGCLTHTEESRSALLSWDYGHFTTLGAHSVLKALKMD